MTDDPKQTSSPLHRTFCWTVLLILGPANAAYSVWMVAQGKIVIALISAACGAWAAFTIWWFRGDLS